jgi:hypothetical protein
MQAGILTDWPMRTSPLGRRTREREPFRAGNAVGSHDGRDSLLGDRRDGRAGREQRLTRLNAETAEGAERTTDGDAPGAETAILQNRAMRFRFAPTQPLGSLESASRASPGSL